MNTYGKWTLACVLLATMTVKFDRATLFNTFLKLQIIVPRYSGFHSMPGLSFHNNDDHKMVFHTWRTQNAVEKTYALLNNLGRFNNYTNLSHFYVLSNFITIFLIFQLA